jgi:hypothetical protein
VLVAVAVAYEARAVTRPSIASVVSAGRWLAEHEAAHSRVLAVRPAGIAYHGHLDDVSITPYGDVAQLIHYARARSIDYVVVEEWTIFLDSHRYTSMSR